MTALKLCPTCGSEYPANERFCPRDGSALRSQGGDDDLVGSVIAERYHVLRKLGEGGMGQVYLAEHVKMGRRSAVKVMNPAMVHDADAISRFNREAANASRINHPNVAGIYDFGETPDGIVYLAMEFVEGETLASIVAATGALPPMRAATITRQAAEGLAAAHDLGIVHRDLKPDNIMIARHRDGADWVKVVDFGIARAAGTDAQKVTRTGMVVGTPEYMSPEQLAGDRLDQRSDIYSLALVAFNMLTGTLPFPSETAQASMIMRLTERPRTLREMNASVAWPAGVQAVMDRALERDATLRYATVGAFGDALHQAIGAMPTSAIGTDGTLLLTTPAPAAAARPLPSTRVAPARTRRMPALVGSGVVIAAAVVGGVIFLSQGGAAATPPAGTTAAPTPVPVTVAPPTAPASIPMTAGVSRAAVTAAPPARADAHIRTLLPALLEQSGSEDRATATEALAIARGLVARATRNDDLVGLGLVRAQALGMLGRDAESCTVLHSIDGSAQATPYAGRITQLLKDGCAAP